MRGNQTAVPPVPRLCTSVLAFDRSQDGYRLTVSAVPFALTLAQLPTDLRRSMLASPAQYDYSHPNYSYDQYVAEEAARYAAAAKVTAAALATSPEEKASNADKTKLTVGRYLDALRTSQEDRDAEADRLAKTPYRGGAY